jgi:hypothetical protein
MTEGAPAPFLRRPMYPAPAGAGSVRPPATSPAASLRRACRVTPTPLLAAACELRRMRAPTRLLRSRFHSRVCARNRASFTSSGLPFLRYPFAKCAPRFPALSASISGAGDRGSVQLFDYRRNTLTSSLGSELRTKAIRNGFSHLP